MARNRSCTLYLKGIPEGSRHEDLRRVCGKYGQLYDVSIPMDYYTGRMKGYAFVEYEDARDAEDAMYRLDRTRFLGREIEVEMARGARKTPSEMRYRDRCMQSSRRYGDGRGNYEGRGGGYNNYGGGPGRRRRSFNSRSRSRSPFARRKRGSPVGRVSRPNGNLSNQDTPPTQEHEKKSRSRSRS